MPEQFTTLLADPPWPYRSPNAVVGNGGRGPRNAARITQVNVEQHYPTMSVEEICRLDVRSLSARNAHLYLWTTNAFVAEAHDVARAWGFEPKTLLTWVKTKRDGSPSIKAGYWYRSATEHILFCVRGSLRLSGPTSPNAYFLPRLPHSVKPDYFYELIEEQSPGPYLELFARRSRDGWSSWGNEVDGPILRQGDNRQLMQTMSPESIDLTLTSPPYDEMRRNFPHEWDPAEFARQLYRLTKPGGVAVVVIDDSSRGMQESGTSARLIVEMQGAGWRLFQTLYFVKHSPRFPLAGRYPTTITPMYVFSKGKPKTHNALLRKNKDAGKVTRSGKFDRSGRRLKEEWVTREVSRRTDAWTYTTHDYGPDDLKKQHSAIMPLRLALDHVRAWSEVGDCVFDPFAGSGTTLIAAQLLDRNPVGIEVVAEYVKLARQRLSWYSHMDFDARRRVSMMLGPEIPLTNSPSAANLEPTSPPNTRGNMMAKKINLSEAIREAAVRLGVVGREASDRNDAIRQELGEKFPWGTNSSALINSALKGLEAERTAKGVAKMNRQVPKPDPKTVLAALADEETVVKTAKGTQTAKGSGSGMQTAKGLSNMQTAKGSGSGMQTAKGPTVPGEAKAAVHLAITMGSIDAAKESLRNQLAFLEEMGGHENNG